MVATSLYNNIPTNTGEEAVNETLYSAINLQKRMICLEVIVEFLKLILIGNNFEFNENHF